jgi:alkylated DNA repair protein alkB family protein 1
MDASLGGHVDYSEPNIDAPLVSISFGQSAIFLIGGPNKSDKPVPILIQNGDVMIMTQKARQSYHGVPKIVNNNSKHLDFFSSSSSQTEEDESDFVQNYLSNHRINMNVRQVY